VSIGDSIWRYVGGRGWRERFVVGETRVSWIIGETRDTTPEQSWRVEKIAKAALRLATWPIGWAPNREAVDRDIWVSANAYRISEAVRRVRNYTTLREIARLAGYEAEEPQR